MEVMEHFDSYMDIPQVKQLSDQVRVQIVPSIINRIDSLIYFPFSTKGASDSG